MEARSTVSPSVQRLWSPRCCARTWPCRTCAHHATTLSHLLRNSDTGYTSAKSRPDMNRPSETTHLVVLMTRLAVLTLSSPWHILVTSAYILLAHERVYSPVKLACRVFSARPVPVASITTARIRLLAVNHTPHTDIVSTSGRIWSPYRPGTL